MVVVSLPEMDAGCFVGYESPRVNATQMGKVALFEHQRAMVHAMRRLENGPVRLDARTTASTTVGVLCDPVGTGKSMSVLALIHLYPRILGTLARTVPVHSGRVPGQSHAFLGVWEEQTFVCDDTSSLNLVVVPSGGVFRQWERYAQDAAFGDRLVTVDTRKKLRVLEDNPGRLDDATVVLVSSTMYRDFAHGFADRVTFHRMFVDEADSIKIPNMRTVRAGMYWLVTSSWRNLAFHSGLIPIPLGDRVRTYARCDGVSHHGFVRDVCRTLLQDYTPRTHFLFLRCDPTFLQTSCTLPPVHHRVVLCRMPSNAVAGTFHRLMSHEISSLIHAGDLEGAVARLGCSTANDTRTLSMALAENTRARCEERKARLRYTETVYGAHDARCAPLRDQIAHLEDQIECIRQRCETSVEEDVCPVCYDVPGTDGPLCATRCCAKVFCLNCLQKSLACTNGRCVMCRASLSDMRHLVVVIGDTTTSGSESNAHFKCKEEALVDLITCQYPEGRFLVFSMHDRTFPRLLPYFRTHGITHDRLVGNTHQIAAKLARFESGDLRVLLLNATCFGQGYNLQTATHVVLFHKMSDDLTQQIVGRAQRFGRQEALRVVQLFHVGEEDSMISNASLS